MSSNIKVGFACRSNVGRSQVAAAFYNRHHGGGAESYGTILDHPEHQYVGDWLEATNVIAAMNEVDIDITWNRRTQLTEARLQAFGGLVVVMAEPESIPLYLQNYPNAVFWDIPDFLGLDMGATRVNRDLIEQQVLKL